MIALDTSVLVDVERRVISTIRLVEEIQSKYRGQIMLPFVVFSELVYGFEILKKAIPYEIGEFPLMIPNSKTAITLARLRVKCDKNGIKLPIADLFIAAQCIDLGCVLVTKDNHFSRISELQTVIVS